jgi:hypothetical protein
MPMTHAELLRTLSDHGLAIFTDPEGETSILPFEEDGISFNLTLMVDDGQVGLGSPEITRLASEHPQAHKVMAALLDLNPELSWIRLHREPDTGTVSGLYLMPVPELDASVDEITETIFGVANDIRAVIACINAATGTDRSAITNQGEDLNLAIERLFSECCDEHQPEHPTDGGDAA